jgi:phage-related protein
MAGSLPAGSVAINILAEDGSFTQVLGKVQNKGKNFQKTVNNVGMTKFPGFQNPAALLRDYMVTFAAVDHVYRRVKDVVRSVATEFASFGDSIAKMSRRTGIGANDLSLLGFAAEQSGSSLADVGMVSHTSSTRRRFFILQTIGSFHRHCKHHTILRTKPR